MTFLTEKQIFFWNKKGESYVNMMPVQEAALLCEAGKVIKKLYKSLYTLDSSCDPVISTQRQISCLLYADD